MHFVTLLETQKFTLVRQVRLQIFCILKFALLDKRRARKYSKPNYSILWILSYLHLLLHVFPIADGCDKYLNFVRILKEFVTQLCIQFFFCLLKRHRHRGRGADIEVQGRRQRGAGRWCSFIALEFRSLIFYEIEKKMYRNKTKFRTVPGTLFQRLIN